MESVKDGLNSIWITARYELDDAMRSRRAVVVLVLYLAGAMLACNGVISVLHRLEGQLTETLGLSAGSSPGAVVDAMWHNREFRRMMGHLAGDRELADHLLSVPPLGLVYGWLAFTFTPVLVMLSCSGRVAEEVERGSVRFVLTRTTRFAWCAGKFLGQAMMLVVALLLSVIGAWCIARFRLSGLNGFDAAAAMVRFGARAWVYSLAFVGMALAISQLTRQPYLAMGAGFLAWIGSSVLALAARHFAGDGARRLWTLAGMLVPQGHRPELWRGDLPHLLPAVVFLLALAAVYLMAGHVWFARRDV